MAGNPSGQPRDDKAGAGTPRPSYYVRNPWRNVSAGAFAGASTVLTVTTLFYALGRLPLVLVGAGVVLAALAFGFGMYARRRAAQVGAGIFGGDRREASQQGT